MEKQFIFITGGARSGKSSFAEKYAATLAQKGKRNLYYLATSKKEDDEMMDRIKRHQFDRIKSGYGWETVECSDGLVNTINSFQSGSVVVLDCLTVLLTNELFRYGFNEEDWGDNVFQEEVLDSIMDGITALIDQVHRLVVVSNEVSYEPGKKDQFLVQTYCRLLGRLHQKIVQKSTEAYVVEAGIPILMKGRDKKCKEL